MAGILRGGSSTRQSAVFLVGIAAALVGIGLLHVLGTTLTTAMREGSSISTSFVKQSFAALLAGAACWFFARIDYRRIVAWAPRLLLLTWIGLLLVLVVGTHRHGARRWINLGFYSLQVSEVAKFAIILFAAHYASVRSRVMTDYRRGFVPAAGCLGFTVVLVALEPDFGTSMFLLAIGFILLFLGGLSLRHILLTGFVCLPPFLLLMLGNFGHIQARLMTIRDGPHEQVRQALHAMGNGGLLGTGLGLGRAQLRFLPFVESDFIFAAVGEQLGFLGSMSVVVLFLAFFWHGLRIALRAADLEGFLVAFGVTFMVTFQAAINMAVVTGLIPPKGIGLPFVSYGGSSLLMLGISLGLMWSIARRGVETAPERESGIARGSSLRDPLLESNRVIGR